MPNNISICAHLFSVNYLAYDGSLQRFARLAAFLMNFESSGPEGSAAYLARLQDLLIPVRVRRLIVGLDRFARIQATDRSVVLINWQVSERLLSLRHSYHISEAGRSLRTGSPFFERQILLLFIPLSLASFQVNLKTVRSILAATNVANERLRALDHLGFALHL